MWSPDEVIEKLNNAFNISISRPTLLRYEKLGLIPGPERGGTGRRGRYTNYPEETVAEAYASWCLLHGQYGGEEKEWFGGKMPSLSPVFVKTLREKIVNNQITWGTLIVKRDPVRRFHTPYYEPSEEVFATIFGYYWKGIKEEALKNLKSYS